MSYKPFWLTGHPFFIVPWAGNYIIHCKVVFCGFAVNNCCQFCTLVFVAVVFFHANHGRSKGILVYKGCRCWNGGCWKSIKNVIIGLDPIIYFFVIQRFTKRDSRVEHGNDIFFSGLVEMPVPFFAIFASGISPMISYSTPWTEFTNFESSISWLEKLLLRTVKK